MDNNTRCYEGIQRIYRNAVVRYLRTKMTAAFGQEALAKLREPFKREEWEAIEAAATSPRASGHLDAPVGDAFDLLSVNHFFNIFDKYWSTLMESAPDAALERTSRRSILDWMREIKGLRDPLSHPAEADFTREDSFRVLDCARRVLGRLDCQRETAEIMDLIDLVLERAEGDERHLDHRLPSKESVVVDFVGRAKELEVLRAWFDEPTSAVWALAGEGGKGKSAIAYTFAQYIQAVAPAPFQVVLWLSAKKRRFIEGVTTDLDSPDFHDLATALSQVLDQLGWAEDCALPVESRRVKVLELLTAFPALVVVDDVDSLDAEGEDAINFFSHQVSRTKSKVLFTSRRTLFGLGAATTHVGGFPPTEAAAFIESRIGLMGLDRGAFAKKIVQQIIRITDGSPLFMEDLVRLSISARSPGAALEMWQGRAGTEVRRYALERECELLTESARNLLLAGCAATGSVSFSELSGIVGVDEDTVISGLQELRKLFLMPAPTFVRGEQRFSVNVNTRALVREVYGGTEQWRRIAAAYETITQGLPFDGRSKIGAIIRQCGLLVRGGRRDEAETLMNSALAERPGDSDLYGFSGWIYKNWTPVRLADARRQFARAAELKSIKEEMYEHWARLEMDQREWTRAAEAAEKGLELLGESAQLRYWAGRARGHLAKELLGGLHNDRAAEEARAARGHLEGALETVREEDKVGTYQIYRALVLLCEAERDVQGVGRFLRRWAQDGPMNDVFKFEKQRLEDKFRRSFG